MGYHPSEYHLVSSLALNTAQSHMEKVSSIVFIRLDCGCVCKGLPWILIDIEGPHPLRPGHPWQVVLG